MRSLTASLLVLAGVTGAACSDPNALPNASNPNFEDTLTIYALQGTPIQSPSAFSVLDGLLRTDRTSQFDFAYNVDSVNAQARHLLLPQAVLDLQVSNSVNPGLLPSNKTFAGIHRAPSNGYVTEDSITTDVGDIYVIRSRIICNIGTPQYAKIEVLSFDDAARTMTFRVMANNNCGYKDLDPGIPKD
jgi:hypothetical protein